MSELFAEFGPNSGYVEELYKLYLTDPSLVGEEWAKRFRVLDGKEYTNGHHRHDIPNLENGALTQGAGPAPTVSFNSNLVERVHRLISAYRNRGHFQAKINPLTKGIVKMPVVEDLGLQFYGFTSDEMSTEVNCSGFQGHTTMKVSDIVSGLDQVYCGSIGFEFAHLISHEERTWLREEIEGRFHAQVLPTRDTRLRRLQKIIHAEAFESELHRKYVGHKRFSLEGGETLIPMLDTLLETCPDAEVKEAVLGMSHRGRLNTLVNIVGKPLSEVFSEFEDQNVFTALGSGDVKYHMGYKASFSTSSGGVVALSLAPNPSHLEFVDPVVEGVARAKQDLSHERNRRAVLPILIHGDAAFIGQGVVAETLNMSDVAGYRTGGTVHIIVNNQIGFTTNPDESRSSTYCTDMAKGVQAPVFHVNAEDVEAACWVTRLALEFRLKFARDVVIDLYCYRKYGHNEGDDPSFTQPLSYSEIKTKKPISKIYSDMLVALGDTTESEVEGFFEAYKNEFDDAQKKSKTQNLGEGCSLHGRLRKGTPDTGVEFETLQRVAQTLITYPENFVPHPKLHKILEKRVETLTEGAGIDWGFAEVLAFGSLVLGGYYVRLSGQDCGRGTFSQRHVALNHYEEPRLYYPLASLSENIPGSGFEVLNSTLSEAAVMGFEFGFSTEAKKSLVMWEGQFGDFANGAQVIIDQFLVASEQKWNQLSGLTLLLPHGYEGQGPEHSSARLERYLQLGADGNMTVAYPSSANQYFHLLRRQAFSEIQRPLVVMTPKSLLRSADAACTTKSLTSGRFQPVLETDLSGGKPAYVIFCTGKVAYDIIHALEKEKKAPVKVVRLEQLYPFPTKEIEEIVKGLKTRNFIWVQEEPKNMGAWSFVESYLEDVCGEKLHYFGRAPSASTATGSGKHHAREQKEFISALIQFVTPQFFFCWRNENHAEFSICPSHLTWWSSWSLWCFNCGPPQSSQRPRSSSKGIVF